MLEHLYSTSIKRNIKGLDYEINPVNMSVISQVLQVETHLLDMFAEENISVEQFVNIILTEFPIASAVIISNCAKVIDPKDKEKGYQEIPMEVADKISFGESFELLTEILEASKLDGDAIKKSFLKLKEMWAKTKA